MHKTIEEIALWNQKTFPKNCLILKVQESKFHLKLSNREYHGQMLYKVINQEKLEKERNNISTDKHAREICPQNT